MNARAWYGTIPNCLHGAVVTDVEEVLLQPAAAGVPDGHVAPSHAAPDLMRGVPHELRVVSDLVEVVCRRVVAVLDQEDELHVLSNCFYP